MKFANLHLHSTYSDGTLTPEQLVYIGKSLGYKALALTDHETDGGTEAFARTAEKEGIDTLLGVEFYGMFEGFNLHLTALDFDKDNPILRKLISERLEIHHEVTRQRVLLGIEKGYIDGVTWDDVERYNDEGSWFCAASLVRAYRALRIPMPEGWHERIWKSEVAQAIPIYTPTAERVIKAVRAADGIIAIAHPYKRTHLIPQLVELGLNGVEVSHPDNKDDTPELALAAAKTYNLYHCGGTDHTGAMSGMGGKHAIPALHGITEEEYLTIKERRLN